MKNEDKFIQELFSSKLQHAEAPVDPAIWEGISNALPAATSAAAATTVGVKLGTLGWVAAAVIVAGIAVATLVRTTDPNPTKSETTQEVVVEAAQETPDAQPVEELEPSQPETKVQAQNQQHSHTSPKVEATIIPVEEAQELESNPIKDGTQPKQQDGSKEDNNVVESSEEHEDNPVTPKAPNPLLTAEFSIKEDNFEDLTYQFSPAFEDGATYIWNFGDGSTSDQLEPTHRYYEQGAYTVQLTTVDSNGFESTFEQELNVVLPALLVLPNTFTPDNSGTNDYLKPAIIARNVQVLKMIVFSTKGELIFEQDPPEQGWDGNLLDGSPAPTGDYVLIVKAIDASGENITKQRKVLLQRN